MTQTQREFLLWWLINYGQQPVNFYDVREEYLGYPPFIPSNELYDIYLSKMLSNSDKGFRRNKKDAYLPDHIVKELRDAE